VKAPTCSTRGPRCALRSLRSLQCLRRPPSSSTSPLSFPPTQTDKPAGTGGNERGRSLAEPRGSKHRRAKPEERSEQVARPKGAPPTLERRPQGAVRTVGGERAGAFTLFAVLSLLWFQGLSRCSRCCSLG